MNVDEVGLPLLWADRHSPELYCAAVNSPQQPVTELYAIHKMPRDFCQALLLRIDQNSSGEAMDYPGFVSWRTVAGIGAKFDTEKTNFLVFFLMVRQTEFSVPRFFMADWLAFRSAALRETSS